MRRGNKIWFEIKFLEFQFLLPKNENAEQFFFIIIWWKHLIEVSRNGDT